MNPRRAPSATAPTEHTPPRAISFRPSPAMIILRPLWVLILLAVMFAVTFWLSGWLIIPAHADWPLAILLGTLVVVLIISFLQWACTRYELGDGRIVATMGVLRRLSLEARLAKVQHIAMTRSLPERLCGVGTIGVATPASGGGYDVVWQMVGRPHERLALVRCAASLHNPSHAPALTVPASATRQSRLPVIGVAGGIGAGKSRVAAEFGKLGWLVIDSDALAREALNRPDVRDKLVAWWGEGIFQSRPNEGAPSEPRKVDRSKVAAIVFERPAERERLEALIHPIVRSNRAEMIADARTRGHVGVVIDAPLLFEAGLDAECDAVVFVDCPRDQRLARVAASRGWDQAELDRRESAQWPLDRKRERCRFTVNNADGAPPLAEQLRPIAQELTKAQPEPPQALCT